jgi:hypothetical protein
MLRNAAAAHAPNPGCSCCRYKAYFRWNHYGHKLKNDASILPTETDACPSVTAAFLQVIVGGQQEDVGLFLT